MPIRFVSNDMAVQPRIVKEISPTAPPSGSKARFTFSRSDPEGVYAPDDNPAFVYWQCKETAHRVMAMWEALAGPLLKWQSGQLELPVTFSNIQRLQAVYDRSHIAFYVFPLTTPKTYVAASSDAVAHELGHAILDAIRPDLWESPLPEVAAFHEGFSDCIALLLALHDPHQRAGMFGNGSSFNAVLQSPQAPSAVSESIAEAAKLMFPITDPRTWARQCRNTLQWDLPSRLFPTATRDGLSSEPHSFGRIFAGCFFDVLANIYFRSAQHTPDSLLNAARTAGALLVEAAKVVPKESRFFQAVGRAMIHVDGSRNNGVNHLSIRDGFAAHNVALGSSAMLAATASLAGPLPSINSAGASSTMLVPQTRHSLCDLISAPPSTAIRLRPLNIGVAKVVAAGFSREISLDELGGDLAGVMANVRENVLLGKGTRRGAVLGQLPVADSTRREVEALAEALLENGSIYGAQGVTKRALSGSGPTSELSTHGIRKKGNKRHMYRLRFACGG